MSPFALRSCSCWPAFVLLQIVNNSQDVLLRLQGMTRRVAQEQARQAEQVEDRTRALRLAADIGRSLTQILNPDDLFSTLVNTVQRNFNFYYVQLYLLDESGRNLVFQSGTGHNGQQLQPQAHTLFIQEGVIGRAAMTRMTVLIEDVSDSSKFTANPLLPETRSELAVPLLAGDTLLGVIDVQHHVAHALTENDANLLAIVAGQAGVALRNARQFQAAEARALAAARRTRIREIIQGTSDIESLLRITARELGEALDAEHTTVFVDAGLLGEPTLEEQAV